MVCNCQLKVSRSPLFPATVPVFIPPSRVRFNQRRRPLSFRAPGVWRGAQLIKLSADRRRLTMNKSCQSQLRPKIHTFINFQESSGADFKDGPLLNTFTVSVSQTLTFARKLFACEFP